MYEFNMCFTKKWIRQNMDEYSYIESLILNDCLCNNSELTSES